MFRPIARTLLNTSRRTFSSTSTAEDVAKLTLCGRVINSPETIEAHNGSTFLKYAVVTGFGMGEARRSTFWNVAVFDEKQKEIVSRLTKGATVYVDADIDCKQIPDENGKNHTYINLYQRSINIIFRGRNASSDASSDAEGAEETHSQG
ncbi:hypothetical protein L211DRAFT_846976 [Terfezia boudieri ATCC MYA-4762]|uniref:Single-stranded DNA-binding protein n=1 Tax=Terfezia boudieri ATCC MYA-4762 TaxID=1051890 RepID=A0A3N4M0A0_9PEZI|nr:hypothetical protein L211DRAFT_846976 [Terfezia boudieri ATCC MYA-4762]